MGEFVSTVSNLLNIICAVKEATSPSELKNKLIASDIPPSANAHSFGEELFN